MMDVTPTRTMSGIAVTTAISLGLRPAQSSHTGK